MIVWLVALPAVLLALAFAGANWKKFDLWRCRRMLASNDMDDKLNGLELIRWRHLRQGLTLEDCRRLFAPLLIEEETDPDITLLKGEREFLVHPAGRMQGLILVFDADGRLLFWDWNVM